MMKKNGKRKENEEFHKNNTNKDVLKFIITSLQLLKNKGFDSLQVMDWVSL
jgi:hypothetical protein